jgi:hypothetical protein
MRSLSYLAADCGTSIRAVGVRVLVEGVLVVAAVGSWWKKVYNLPSEGVSRIPLEPRKPAYYVARPATADATIQRHHPSLPSSVNPLVLST